MDPGKNIERVAVVGAGLIGSSWAAHFLARGLDVSVTDPAPGAERGLREQIDRAWPIVTQLGLAPGASRNRLHFTPALEAAVAGADFVQENGPEREELKVKLFAELDRLVPPDVILASSSSGLKMSAIQAGCRHPERCVIGHPFNPPHLIPLVEVVGGRSTAAACLERACAFYIQVGKKPILLHKEVTGHVANRLQAALWREAVHLVEQGVISVGDVDDAVSWGPGLRWGVMGPNLIFHLGGGPGGIRHFMAHLAGPFSRWWADLGKPELTADLQAKLIAGVETAAAGQSIAELETYRDQMIIALLAARARAARDKPPGGG
ncbi:MAG: 3-hydroxyacyl-CoA dehydrogenase NAD-binding domain-containing protein [Lacunisphaera sp.]|nr:3-hydroxyacyl-CoA dehydrogenase NAD-binding domain-containing protein [Lacunisphaera sp.]